MELFKSNRLNLFLELNENFERTLMMEAVRSCRLLKKFVFLLPDASLRGLWGFPWAICFFLVTRLEIMFLWWEESSELLCTCELLLLAIQWVSSLSFFKNLKTCCRQFLIHHVYKSVFQNYLWTSDWILSFLWDLRF